MAKLMAGLVPLQYMEAFETHVRAGHSPQWMPTSPTAEVRALIIVKEGLACIRFQGGSFTDTTPYIPDSDDDVQLEEEDQP